MSDYTFREPISTHIKRNRIKSLSDILDVLNEPLYSLDGVRIKDEYEWYALQRRGGRLPVIADNAQTFHGDLIPSTSWGSSLANMLTKTSWDALRNPVIEQNHHICGICGTRHSVLDVHELWSYGFPSPEEIQQAEREDALCFGVQRLDGLLPVCEACHACYHLGLAKVEGTLSRALDRIGLINQWVPEQVDRYESVVFQRFKQASSIHWMLDISTITHPQGGLTLKTAWSHHPDDARFLVTEGKWGEQITRVIGIPYRIGKEDWRPAQPLE